MKLTILQQDFLPALSAAFRSCGVRSTLPVLANILLSAQDNKLKVSATNLEVGVIKTVNAKVGLEGEITIPARTLVEIVSSLDGEISLEVEGDQLSISTTKFSAKLAGIPASEFPAIPLSEDAGILIDAKTLSLSLPKIAFAAAADEGRPILTGVLTEVKKDALEFIATDGFRLAHQKSKIESKDLKPLQALIPKRTLDEVVRLIAEEDGVEKVGIAISENQNQIIFTINETKLSSRLIEGQFPSWEKTIPHESINKTVVDRAELLKGLKLASVFAKDSANIVKLTAKTNAITLASEAKELGGQETKIEAKSTGEEVVVAFNNKFLIDALSSCTSAQVSIEFSGNLSAVLIRPLEEEGLEYIVIPVRLN